MKNKKVIVTVIIIMIVLVSLGIILFTGNEDNNRNNNASNGSSFVDNNGNAPSRVDKEEKDVSKSLANELYSFIPKMYYEEIAPFSSVFMMDAVMNKILDEDDNADFSAAKVDKYVEEIFGKGTKIDKLEVSTPDINKSIFYYSKEAETYAIIPVGYAGLFKKQILKNVTETEEAYYVYTYALNGIYYNEEEAIVTVSDDDNFTDDEFFDENYENGKVRVIIGDKDGYDLVHIFDNYSLIYDDEIWLKNYENKMPVFRYTLKKDSKSYYLTEVEQISY